MNKKVLLGMSGGADSSVSVLSLQRDGFEVVGVTFKLYSGGSRCCDVKDINNASYFAHKAGIKHFVIDLENEFKEHIIQYFIDEYKNGKTPNPCVVCNSTVKFPFLLKKMSAFGLDYIATGHYAGVEKLEDGDLVFKKGKDLSKSQEYFLARVDKNLIGSIKFPLSDCFKTNINDTWQNLTQQKVSESQEVCFIPDASPYYDFILNEMPQNIKDEFRGVIKHETGKILQETDCFFKYTPGQRKGLGISNPVPLYVIKVNPTTKEVIVGERDSAYSGTIVINNVYSYVDKLFKQNQFDAKVKIRYNSPEKDATVEMMDENRAKISFAENQFAPAVGQLAVVYQDDKVVGSGWIEEVFI